MGLDDRTRDREAETAPAAPPASREVCPVKAVEDSRPFFGGNPRTVIVDSDSYPPGPGAGRHPHQTIGARVPNRVLDEIAEYLGEAVAVRQEPPARHRLHLHAPAGAATDPLRGLGDEPLQV